jgi:hypothetical protein
MYKHLGGGITMAKNKEKKKPQPKTKGGATPSGSSKGGKKK